VNTAERRLKLLLRIVGIMSLFAVVGAVMPHSWLVWAVDRVEPETRARVLVSYLARLVSWYYVLLGGLLLIFTTDIRRYAAPIGLVAIWTLPGPIGVFIFGRAAIAAGLAGWFFWCIAADSIIGCAIGISILLLQRRIGKERLASTTGG
jgi:hypothetical protein